MKKKKNFDIITIFPQIFSAKGGSVSDEDSYGYFGSSIIKRAQKNSLIKINIHNLRDFSTDRHRTVDDTPYGGGPGMVMKAGPIFRAVESIKSRKSKKTKARIILFSAKGKKYSQKDAKRLLKYDNFILICGRYEGVDERVAKYIADEEVSIGDYILTGGEIPAMIIIDSVTRLIPGVLGNAESPKSESHSIEGQLEYPQYTKPETYNKWIVPKILLSGNHLKIEEWRKAQSKKVKS